jgi:hypothetical protein
LPNNPLLSPTRACCQSSKHVAGNTLYQHIVGAPLFARSFAITLIMVTKCDGEQDFVSSFEGLRLLPREHSSPPMMVSLSIEKEGDLPNGLSAKNRG